MSHASVRTISALALIAAPAVTTAAFAIDITPQAESTEDLLRLVVENPQPWSTALWLFLLSGLLWVPAGLGLLRLFGRERPLGWWGAAAVLVGGVAIVPLDAAGWYLQRVATSGVSLPEQAAIVEGVDGSVGVIALEVVHVVGLFAGLLVVAIALIRSRLVPRSAPAAAVIGLAVLIGAPLQLAQTAGMALLTVALATVAVRVFRMSDDQWHLGAAADAHREAPVPA